MRPPWDFPTLGHMELIIMVLVPLPLGLLVRNRTAAYIAYIAIHAFVFTFQTANLVMDWANGSTEAFGSFPDYSMGDFWAYGIINLAIYGVGLGLVTLGYRIRTKRNARRSSVELTPG
jgi:predicted Na+-dependent transporter